MEDSGFVCLAFHALDVLFAYLLSTWAVCTDNTPIDLILMIFSCVNGNTFHHNTVQTGIVW